MDPVTGTCDDCGAEGVTIWLTEYNWQCAKCKDTDDEITPASAIRDSIVSLRLIRRQSMREPSEEDITPHLDRQIAALELAQWELGEYRKLKTALATLRAAMP